jgi:Oxidoreductase molybdopterin binding domain
MSDRNDRLIEDPKPEVDAASKPLEPVRDGLAESAAASGESELAEPADANAIVPSHPVESVDEDTREQKSSVESEAQQAAAQPAADEAVFAESRRHTRRSFVVAAAGAAAGYGFYHWIGSSPGDEMQPHPFRRAFETNAAIARGVTGDRALSPTYALEKARDLRVNGVYGLKRTLQTESWRLQVVGTTLDARHPRFSQDVTAWEYRYTEAGSKEDQGHDTKIDPNASTAEKMAPASMMDQAKAQEDRAERMPRGQEEAGESRSTLMPRTPGLLLTMDDVRALPRHELVTQFKCIEGWSEIVHWAGVRMADFVDAYPPQLIDGKEPRYVYMETPDGDYYTGYDLDACRHPQTLLVTEMMGAPLTQFHGAPLRLHMPIKYGYKQIKRIGLIAYTNEKPDDYWTKLGYDWYAGL